MTAPTSLAILSNALQASAGKAVEDNASRLLGELLGAVVAGPAGAALVAVVKELIGALFASTSAIERKLDTVLEEPLATAVRVVKETASVPLATGESRREQQRQLARAYDLLAKAHTYADKRDPEKVLLVRYYQTLVAAMPSCASGRRNSSPTSKPRASRSNSLPGSAPDRRRTGRWR